MHRIASAAFEITEWTEEPWDEGGAVRLTRARVRKSFTGDIEGTSVAELLLATVVEGTARAYVGFERIDASVHGRSGSFVLHHTATTSNAGQAVSWSIVPDSGSGQLERIAGEAQMSVGSDGSHAITLDYDIDL